MSEASGTTSTSTGRWVAVLVVVAAIVALWFTVDVGALLKSALEWIDDQGVWAPLIFVAAYVIVTVVLIPPSLFTVGGGVIFGVAMGSLWVFIGANIGALAAFLIGRYLAHNAVQQRVADNDKFNAVAGAIAQEGWKVVVLTRLSPVFPFGLQNYAYSVTGISTRDYLAGTLVGMIPGIIMYTYIGSVVGDLATLGGGERTRSASEWVLYGVGLAATVLVTVWITRKAQAALERREAPQ